MDLAISNISFISYAGNPSQFISIRSSTKTQKIANSTYHEKTLMQNLIGKLQKEILGFPI